MAQHQFVHEQIRSKLDFGFAQFANTYKPSHGKIQFLHFTNKNFKLVLDFWINKYVLQRRIEKREFGSERNRCFYGLKHHEKKRERVISGNIGKLTTYGCLQIIVIDFEKCMGVGVVIF